MTRSRITDITPSRLAQLNRGEAEASNLTECLAVDFAPLMQCTLPSLGPQALASMHAASGEGITRRMALAARLLLTESGTRDLAALSRHPSDTVRGWACFMVGASEGCRSATAWPSFVPSPMTRTLGCASEPGSQCERPLLRSSRRPLPPWCPGRRSRPSDCDALPAKQPGPAASGVPILRPCDKHRSRP